MKPLHYVQRVGFAGLLSAAAFCGMTHDARAQSDKDASQKTNIINPFSDDTKFFQKLRNHAQELEMLDYLDSAAQSMNIHFVDIHPRYNPHTVGYFDYHHADSSVIGMSQEYSTAKTLYALTEEITHGQQHHALNKKYEDPLFINKETYYILNLVLEADAKAQTARKIVQAPESNAKEDVYKGMRHGRDGALQNMSKKGIPTHMDMQKSFRSFFTYALASNKEASDAPVSGTGLCGLYSIVLAENAHKDVKEKSPFNWDQTKEMIMDIIGPYMKETVEKSDTPRAFFENISSDDTIASHLSDTLDSLSDSTQSAPSKGLFKPKNK